MSPHQAREIYAGCTLILALAQLKERERHAVIGHHMRGLTFQQIADEAGCTRQACQLAETRGIAKLHTILAADQQQLAA